MHKRFVAVYRLIFGVLTLLAIKTQYIHNLNVIANYNKLNFFSFFTIESNLFIAVIFLVSAVLIWQGKTETRNLSLLRGAAALYMTITGLVYILLLRGVAVDSSVVGVNAVLHYLMPVVAFVDWFMVRPPRTVKFKAALTWLIFPITYLAYSLLRGHATGWYPYPFLSPAKHGYVGVLIASLVIAIVATGLSWLFTQKPGKLKN